MLQQKTPTFQSGFLSQIWRSRADSNRCRRFCRPVPSRSATRPFSSYKVNNIFRCCKWYENLFFYNYLVSRSFSNQRIFKFSNQNFTLSLVYLELAERKGYRSMMIATFSTSPFIGGQILVILIRIPSKFFNSFSIRTKIR